MAWKETGLLTPPPGFERVLDALERKDHAAALRQLKRVWSDQEEMLARFLERREAAAAAAAAPTRKKAKRRRPKGS